MKKNSRIINMGVIGYGYWGPNVARNLQVIDNVNLAAICDKKASVAATARRCYPSIKITHDYRDITSSPDIDAVAVVTPVSTHFELVKAALLNGKHVFVEKPFTSSSREADMLIRLGEKRKLKIMVDHTFLFTGAVRKTKELITNNVLGDILYYDSTRINLGLFQHDIDVIWDLIPHDFAIMDYIIQSRPVAVSAHGMDHFSRGLANLAYVTMHFDNNIIAHFNVNWLSPVKVRLTLVGGTKKMLVWDDLNTGEKIKIYDKGIKAYGKGDIGRLLVEYRMGNMCSPKLDHTEALKLELEYFIKYIKTNFIAINDGYAGLRMVKMLEAADKSLKNAGREVRL